MATMMRWDPFQDLRSAQDELAQMNPTLAHALGQHAQQGGGRATTTAWAPDLDIPERKDAYLVAVELPGVEPDGLQVTLEDGLLTIQGERHFAQESSRAAVPPDPAPLRRLPPLDHPARPRGGGGHPGLGRQRRAADPGAQDEGGHPKRIQVRPGRAQSAAASSGETTPG